MGRPSINHEPNPTWLRVREFDMRTNATDRKIISSLQASCDHQSLQHVILTGTRILHYSLEADLTFARGDVVQRLCTTSFLAKIRQEIDSDKTSNRSNARKKATKSKGKSTESMTIKLTQLDEIFIEEIATFLNANEPDVFRYTLRLLAHVRDQMKEGWALHLKRAEFVHHITLDGLVSAWDDSPDLTERSLFSQVRAIRAMIQSQASVAQVVRAINTARNGYSYPTTKDQDAFWKHLESEKITGGPISVPRRFLPILLQSTCCVLFQNILNFVVNPNDVDPTARFNRIYYRQVHSALKWEHSDNCTFCLSIAHPQRLPTIEKVSASYISEVLCTCNSSFDHTLFQISNKPVI